MEEAPGNVMVSVQYREGGYGWSLDILRLHSNGALDTVDHREHSLQVAGKRDEDATPSQRLFSEVTSRPFAHPTKKDRNNCSLPNTAQTGTGDENSLESSDTWVAGIFLCHATTNALESKNSWMAEDESAVV